MDSRLNLKKNNVDNVEFDLHSHCLIKHKKIHCLNNAVDNISAKDFRYYDDTVSEEYYHFLIIPIIVAVILY